MAINFSSTNLIFPTPEIKFHSHSGRSSECPCIVFHKELKFPERRYNMTKRWKYLLQMSTHSMLIEKLKKVICLSLLTMIHLVSFIHLLSFLCISKENVINFFSNKTTLKMKRELIFACPNLTFFLFKRV